MMLTKDNLLRFVREKKYVTPTNISEAFETTTMIASAALSEIAKEKLISITNLKTGSTPYYYDPRQPQALQDLAEKHLSGNDKAIFYKLRDTEVLNHNSLPAADKLAISKILDFAKELELSYGGRDFKFWVWYLRDINETKKQILDVLNPKKQDPPKANMPEVKKVAKEQEQPRENQKQSEPQKVNPSPFEVPAKEVPENKSEMFIENYLQQNYLKVEEKTKEEKAIKYEASIKINKITVMFDCMYFEKRPTDADIIKFYLSNVRPKIVFIENAPKKFFKLAENLENLEIVNI